MVLVGLSVESLFPGSSVLVGAALSSLFVLPDFDAESVTERVGLEVMLPLPDCESVAVAVGLEDSVVFGTDALADTEP